MDPATAAARDRTLRSRYELKYLVNDATAAALDRELRAFMTLDRFSRGRAGEAYRLASVYYDSADLRLCRESLEGRAIRFKLRARVYSDDPGAPCFVEVKRRLDRTIRKSRAVLARDDVVRLFDGPGAPEARLRAGGADLREFKFLRDAVDARPAALIRYRRKAYEDAADSDNRLRVTFDTDLECAPADGPVPRLDGPRWRAPLPGATILEVKFTGRFPAWLSRVAARYGISSQSVSKYTIGARYLDGAGALRRPDRSWGAA